ncbi:MAG: DUF6067 family protein [Armatimonadetes bacterium]|nr:DUF6067 family protein [Armatimonadota bacterium]MDW8122778.1 DUF6067 family protein [Armatimonadota bacterium]
MIGVCVLSLLILSSPLGSQEVPYELGEWTVEGRGSHRALVRVDQEADAVRVTIPWRRRDPNPHEKGIRVFDSHTQKPIDNVVVIQITQKAGVLAFQPVSGKGLYEVYYLPYRTPKGPIPGGWWKEWYLPPEEKADKSWRERNHLTAEGISSGKWQQLPEAKVVTLQARTEFDRFDPMEMAATEEEVADLLKAHPKSTYFLFAEDRRFPIKMFESIPLRWVRSGPSNRFAAEAQPGEFFVFQIGVWAARKEITDLQLEFSDLKGTDGTVIRRSAFRCFNLGGNDWLGRPFKKTFPLAKGRVRPLWIGVLVPESAKGTFTGTIRVQPKGLEPSTIALVLTVTGDVLKDGGDSDNWRLSRLRWLDSRLGLEDEVVPPFLPVKVKGAEIELLGRTVRFGVSGLPDRIVSNGREILSAPVAFLVETEEKRQPVQWSERKWIKKNEAVAQWETVGKDDLFAYLVQTKVEFDGCLSYRVRLTAKRAARIQDVRLVVPIRQEVAVYMMGMGRRGGLRPKEWQWKWDPKRPHHMVWIGDWNAGLQLKLEEAVETWHCQVIDFRPPQSWHNDGKGGCRITEEKEAFVINAFSGPRSVTPGQTIEFRFRFLITPFKPLDKRRWTFRYGAGGNIVHLHHGHWGVNPYINYPMLTWREIKSFFQEVTRSPAKRNPGQIQYPAVGNLNPSQGSVHLWVRINFDPKAGKAGDAQYNQSLFSVEFPNEDAIGFYWNVDDRGMRAFVRKGSPLKNQYPVLIGSHQPDWQEGKTCVVTLSWGQRFAIFVDGKKAAESPYTGTTDTPVTNAVILLQGSGFRLRAIKISRKEYREGEPIEWEPDPDCLLLDRFADLVGTLAGFTVSRPIRIASGGYGTVTGRFDISEGDTYREITLTGDDLRVGVNIYYTVRELTNHTPELWALRSLGDEILETGGVDIYTDPKPLEKVEKVGHPWLHEHLITGYIPAWMHPFSETDVDCAVAVKGLSRWHNFYVEGLRFLMERTGIDGLYLDGIGYDREVMKRVRRVMKRINPNSRIDFHSGDNWAPPWEPEPPMLSAANQYMEHFPYLDTLWFGELYDYDMPPDYWLVEISGIPFGLMGDMLNYETGGNPYRGMVYGMTGRFHPATPNLWQALDAFGIEDAEMIGNWSGDCPVRTDHPQVQATVYLRQKRALIAIASWAKEDVSVRLQIDWKRLGMEPEKCRLVAPSIALFQPPQTFLPDQPITVPAGKGWLLILVADADSL